MNKLEVRNILKEAKGLLLNDNNINEVHYITNRKVIIVKPNRAKSFMTFKEVFEEFLNEFGDIQIGGHIYSITGFEHFNSTIFSLTLKLKA